MHNNLQLKLKPTFFIWLVLLLDFCTLKIHSQKNSSNDNSSLIQGRVIDESSKRPIQFVTIKLFDKDSLLISGTKSDSIGNFKINTNGLNNYCLKFSLLGYQSKVISESEIVKQFSSEKKIEIELAVVHKNLEEVKVYGSFSLKIDVDKQIYKIDSTSISMNGTAGDLLQNIPSVFVNSEGSVSLRGGKVKIYINGKPSGILGISRSQVLDYIPASLIESIEVINDPSANYDADGNSGIINIVLKSQTQQRIYGMILLGVGSNDKYNGSLNFTYNFKKLSFFCSYDAKSTNMLSWESKDRESTIAGITKHVNQDRNFFSKTLSQNIRTRIQYSINSKSNISFSYLHSDLNDVDETKIRYTHLDYKNDLTKLYDRKINETEKDKSNNFTLNYVKNFKKSQQMLTADFYYSKTNETTIGQIFQQYYNLDLSPSTSVPSTRSKTSNLSNESNIVGQFDYAQPLLKKAKIELGYKTRYRTTSVNYQLYNLTPSQLYYLLDTTISNDFTYQSIINAGYITFRNKYKSFSYKFGLRSEQSNIQFKLGNSLETRKFNYINFFPSAYFLQEFKKNNKLSLRYSRRIDRPAFSEINPLQQYNDPFFLNKGNPDLLPELTNSVNLSHTKSWKKNSLTTSLYYRYSTNSIMRVIILDTSGVTTTNYQNINSTQNIGSEINAYFQVTKWWRINTSINLYQCKIDGTNIGTQFKTDAFSYNGKLNTNFTLWKNSILQLSGSYQSPTYSPLIKNYGQYYFDASFRQVLFNKKVILSIRCSDLLHSQRRKYDLIGSNYYTTSNFTRQSRIIWVGISYRPFGNNKKNEALEEDEDAEENKQNTEEDKN